MPDSDDLSTSPQTGPHLDEILRRISRRRFLGGTVVAAATGFLGGSRLPAFGGDDVVVDRAVSGRLTFKEVPPSSADTFVVPDGYAWAPLAPWGTPLLSGAPPFAEDASNTAAEQARQVG
jgi:secreted PhoX family phosphatase